MTEIEKRLAGIVLDGISSGDLQSKIIDELKGSFANIKTLCSWKSEVPGDIAESWGQMSLESRLVTCVIAQEAWRDSERAREFAIGEDA